MAKKRLSMPSNLDRGLRQIGEMDDNYNSPFRETIISLDSLELDPENPRKLSITREDIEQGGLSLANIAPAKRDELTELLELSSSIKQQGLIHPIIVYKHGEKYRVVAGERRTLASILAGLNKVDARVYQDKPSQLDLKLLQWAENMNRTDLSLYERLLNIGQIQEAFKEPLTPTKLGQLSGISKSQSSAYLSVLRAPEDVLRAVKEKRLNNLDKAAVIAQLKDVTVRASAITQSTQGASLKQLRQLLVDITVTTKIERKGRPVSKINLGSTKSAKVVKMLVESVIQRPEFADEAWRFTKVAWNDVEQVDQAFKQLVRLLEKQTMQVTA